MPIVQPYKEEPRYPGSTKIAGMIDKPFLVKWANKLGKKGIDVDEYTETTARLGTLIHNTVEVFINEGLTKMEEYLNGLFMSYTVNELHCALVGVNKFIEWFSTNDVQPIFTENKFISENYKYCGVLDFYCVLNGKFTIVDFKTSKSITNEQLLQLSSYQPLIEENGLRVDQVMILNIPRDKNIEFSSKIMLKEEQQLYFEIFKRLLDVYYIKYDLDWE